MDSADKFHRDRSRLDSSFAFFKSFKNSETPGGQKKATHKSLFMQGFMIDIRKLYRSAAITQSRLDIHQI